MNQKSFSLLVLWLIFGTASSTALAVESVPDPVCVASFEMLGGVAVRVVNTHRGPEITFDRVSSPESIVAAQEGQNPSLWSKLQAKMVQWRKARAIRVLEKAKEKFDKQPDEEWAHKQFAQAFGKALRVEGIETKVSRNAGGTYQVAFVASRNDETPANWLIDVGNVLRSGATTGGKPAELVFDTGRAIKGNSSYGNNLKSGARRLDLGELRREGGKLAFRAGPGDAHEIYHWTQDQQRLAGSEEAFPFHQLQISSTLPVGPGSGELSPFRHWARENVIRSYAKGYLVEEVGAQAFEGRLSREIVTGLTEPLLAQLPKPSLEERNGILLSPDVLYHAIRAAQLMEVHVVFAENSSAIYTSLLKGAAEKPSSLTFAALADNRLKVSTADGLSIFLTPSRPVGELIVEYQRDPAGLRAELETGLRRVRAEVDHLAGEYQKNKASLTPTLEAFAEFGKDQPISGTTYPDGSPVTFKDLLRWLKEK